MQAAPTKNASPLNKREKKWEYGREYDATRKREQTEEPRKSERRGGGERVKMKWKERGRTKERDKYAEIRRKRVTRELLSLCVAKL